MRHLFVAPADMSSPRWLQAFPAAQRLDECSAVDGAADSIIWLLLRDARSMAQLQSLSASGACIIAMTAIETAGEARGVLEAGASGYVHYLAAPELLVQIAQSVAAGGIWVGAELMRQLILASARVAPLVPVAGADLSLLTSRERAVAELVAAGKTNKEVARALDITERTVKAHLGATFDKLKLRDRMQLALLCSRQV